MKQGILFALAFLALSATGAVADDYSMDGAYLDRPYENLVHPIRLEHSRAHAGPPRSDVERLIAAMTPVRNQASRGTCSIFSATAMLEATLVLRKGQPNSIDLSEEWLEYLITRNRTTDGSNSDANFAAFLSRGFIDERTWPYVGVTWNSVDSDPVARQRCDSVPSSQQKSCLLAHRDPRLLMATDAQLGNPSDPLFDREFLAMRAEAASNKARHLSAGAQGSFFVGTTDEVKALLRAGVPVTLDIDFYYGAWNHRKADELGIGRDTNNWAKGLVGYPEPGSMDRQNSVRERAGHSVLIVGYDDNATITTNSVMTDGRTRSFSYQGVYYFKNSWGTSNFGVSFQSSSLAPAHPGYGAITQKYAEEFGQFFKFPVR